jgi:hypothetical protein
MTGFFFVSFDKKMIEHTCFVAIFVPLSLNMDSAKQSSGGFEA